MQDEWRAITLFIFLVCNQVPLYDIMPLECPNLNPLYWMRVILASNENTLMEVRFMPIVTSGMIMQLLAGANLIDGDFSLKEDRALFDGAQNGLQSILAENGLRMDAVFALMITVLVGQGCFYLLTWPVVYGAYFLSGTGVSLLLIIYLATVAAAAAILNGVLDVVLDELIQLGYGLGSGINLSPATNICESIVWKAFSPTTATTGREPKFEGGLVALFHLLFTWNDRSRALKEAFCDRLPNVMNLIPIVFIFAVVIYLQGFRFEILVKFNHNRGQRGVYPLELFYTTSNMPIMPKPSLMSDVLIVSQMLYEYSPNNLLVKLLGVWEPLEESSQLFAVSGISYYISPPHTGRAALTDPIRTVLCIALTLGAFALFSESLSRRYAKHYCDLL
ncbi:translocon subunit [Tulasnella sp. 417]|nr:translocon subunit [Tulasnella sp. 417]